jgi:3-(3-hydroxy-phenyl)propionate hydroxylase
MTIANELMRWGVRPRIVDKAPSIREVSKAMILHVRTQEALDRVGVVDRLRREGQPLTEVVVHAYGKHVGSWDLDDIEGPYDHPVIIGQNRTQHALCDLLEQRGLQVEWSTEAVSLDVEDSGANVTLKHQDGSQERVRADWIVGAEGSNSLVRKTMKFTFEGERYSGEQFIQADCRIKWPLPSGRSYLFLTSDGYLMVIEFPDGVVRVFISLPDRAGGAGAAEAASQLGAVEAINETPTLEEIASNLSRLSGFPVELSDPIWLARYRTSHRYSNLFGGGRAFVAGDAAHVHVPIGGQGMNTGIQDAFNLSWKLAGVVRGVLRPWVLETYHSERHPVAKALIEGTNFAYTGILHPSEARQRAVRWFGPFIMRSERVQNFMRGTLEELRVFYPESALNLDLGGGRGPAPGERVLDAPLVRSDSSQTESINTITRATSWTLMIFSGLSANGDREALRAAANQIRKPFAGRTRVVIVLARIEAISDPDVYFDALHAAHDAYGVATPGFYLLRPDTYVAARGPLAELGRLVSHLAGVFV